MTVATTPAPRASALSRLMSGLRARGGDTAWGTIMVFLTPALLIYLALTAYPAARTFYNSLHIIKPRGEDVYIGFDNFVALFTSDAIFTQAVTNTMIWAGIAPFIDVGVGLVLALFLYAKVPFGRFFRVAWFTPVLISYVVVGIIWMWIYNYDWGILNGALRLVGLGDWAQSWLGNPDTALWAVMFTHTWKWAGFNMVVCLAALSALPREVLEAGELDNCGWVKRSVFIAIPMIRPTLVNLLILSLIGKMKVFDLVWIMTQGGPLWATETVSTYVYKRAFNWSTFDLGYPSAIAVVWFVVVLVFVLALKWLFRQRDKLEY
ncbi:MAG: sugar ABC transporter permease [Acuticoccus sp.]